MTRLLMAPWRTSGAIPEGAAGNLRRKRHEQPHLHRRTAQPDQRERGARIRPWGRRHRQSAETGRPFSCPFRSVPNPGRPRRNRRPLLQEADARRHRSASTRMRSATSPTTPAAAPRSSGDSATWTARRPGWPTSSASSDYLGYEPWKEGRAVARYPGGGEGPPSGCARVEATSRLSGRIQGYHALRCPHF